MKFHLLLTIILGVLMTAVTHAKSNLLNTVVAKWTPSSVASNYQFFTIDLSKQIKQSGHYSIHFNYIKGEHGLDIASVELLSDDKVISSDEHAGFTGGNAEANIYQLELKTMPVGKLTLKTNFKGRGGTKSYGEIILKKRLFKPVVAGVVPAIRHWKGMGGDLSLKGAKLFFSKKDAKKLHPVSKMFQEDLKLAKLESYTSTQEAIGKLIILRIGTIEQSKSKEAYKIQIDSNITITGNSETGVFYGTRTLLQMLNQKELNGILPKGVIVDWPDYAYRSLLLDVGRAKFPLPVLYDYLRMMSYYKMNELHLHLNDDLTHGADDNDYSGFRVECETFPNLTSKDLFYTKKELREFQKVAKVMGITVVPEFDMPGHSRAFTKIWPELIYMEGGKIPKKGYLDFKNPETVRRLKLLLDEMIPLFDSPDIHIGTDEFRVGGWPKGKEFLELNDSLMLFINDMNKHIRSKGKNTRIWYGTDHIKSVIKPDKTIILDIWNLKPDDVVKVTKDRRFINSCDRASYIVPGATYYGVHNALVYQKWNPWDCGLPRYWNKSDATSLKLKNSKGLMGGKLNLWMDIGPDKKSNEDIFNLVKPSLQVFSERLWGIKASANYEAFSNRSAVKLPIPTIQKK